MRGIKKAALDAAIIGGGVAEAEYQRNRRVVGLAHDCIMSGIFKQGEGLGNGAKTG